MNLKEELLKFKKRVLEGGNYTNLAIECKTNEEQNIIIFKNGEEIKSVDLETKIDEFVNWYTNKHVKGQYTKIGEYNEPKRIRDFIEKMAVWFELRYPEYEVNRLFPCCGQSNQKIDDIMLNENRAIKEVADILDVDKAKDFIDAVSILEWNKFYSKETFIKSLPYDELYYLKEPKYPNLVYVNPDSRYNSKASHFHLSNDGIVEESEYMQPIPGWGVYTEDPFEGMHITEVVKFMKEQGMDLPDNNELEDAITKYNNKKDINNGLLDCVMYHIIERGGNRIGPRRAFLFAKEFQRNIDIPMMYGIDLSDPGLRSFIIEYIKAGGHSDLNCFVDYGSRSSQKEKLRVISVNKLLRIVNHNCIQVYTPEETELYQKLVNSIFRHEQEVMITATEKEKKKIKKLDNK